MIGTYEQWREGRDDHSIVSIAYSSQFYDVCRRLGTRAHVVAAHAWRPGVNDAQFTLRHRPIPFKTTGSALYFAGQVLYAVDLMARAVAFRAQVVVVSTGLLYFLLAPLGLLGMKLVPSLHCAFWPMGFRPRSGAQKLVQWLNGWFWNRMVSATICVSPECEHQVRQVAGRVRGRIFQVRAQYRQGLLDTVSSPPAHGCTPFGIMYAGRVERNKGVFGLLDLAERLERSRPGRFVWDICGSGSALADLQDAVRARRLEQVFRLRGKLDHDQMAESYGAAHVVVVPTTREFAEGLNKVAVEAVLAGRPLVTSRLSNALDVLGEAAVEVPPDDIDAYERAIVRLADDSELYEQKCAACRPVQAQFYDQGRAWGTALEEILTEVQRKAFPSNAGRSNDGLGSEGQVWGDSPQSRRDGGIKPRVSAASPGSQDGSMFWSPRRGRRKARV